MASTRRSRTLFLVFFVLLFPWPPRAAGLNSFGALRQWGTILSLSHSLMERVANGRNERGDLSGAARARAIAHRLQLLGGGGGGGIWSMCWDYVRNYAWREGFTLDGARSAAEIYSAAGEMVSALQEMLQMRSDAERARWVARNHAKLVSAASTILRRLAQAFSRSGALRETVLMFQREVVDGELLRDCLQVGARDLEGLLRVARDLFSSFSTASPASPDPKLEAAVMRVKRLRILCCPNCSKRLYGTAERNPVREALKAFHFTGSTRSLRSLGKYDGVDSLMVSKGPQCHEYVVNVAPKIALFSIPRGFQFVLSCGDAFQVNYQRSDGGIRHRRGYFYLCTERRKRHSFQVDFRCRRIECWHLQLGHPEL